MKYNDFSAAQSFSEESIEVVFWGLSFDCLAQIPAVQKCEEDLAICTSARYCSVVSSKNAAFHLLPLVLDVALGDDILETPITSAVTTNCARYFGADLNLVDICATKL